MEINKIQTDEKITFALKGKLDTISSPQLQEQLIAAFDGAKQVELDFDGVIYVSSAGLRTLLLGEKAANAKGGAMTLVNVPSDVKDVLKITGFDKILKIN